MPGLTKTMIRLELSNLFGLNVLRHTRDPKAKRKGIAMTGVWILLIALVFVYVGGLSYGLILLGAAEAIPAYLMAIAGLVLLFFGMFEAGGVLFRRNGYEILCSLPVTRRSIVISRLARMYAEHLVISLAVLLPGLGVYAWFLRPGAGFFLAAVLAALAVPMLPLAVSSLLGAVVAGISSRMKNKALVEAGLSVGIVVAVLLGSSQLAKMEESFTPEMLKTLAETVLGVLEKLVPPAVWMGRGVVQENPLLCLALGCAFLAVLAAVAAGISAAFHAICRRLFATSARHNYRMAHLKQDSLLLSLYKREAKRYFASGIYVSNTIMGPIMGTLLAGALCFAGVDRIQAAMPMELDLTGLAPFLLASVFCMMPTTAVSISMEGKNLWIVKSLPLSTKSILDAKLLLNLSLMAPFLLVSEALLVFALKPGFGELFWLAAVPVGFILFSCVFGITVNLRLPVMDWESETSVVKQSASAMLGGLGGFLLALLCAVPAVMGLYTGWSKGVLCLLLLAAAALLYRKNQAVDLGQI